MFEKGIDKRILEYYNLDVDKTEHMFEYWYGIRDCFVAICM